MTVKTVTLNDGQTVVLAKETKYGLSAFTFANRTQATKRELALVEAGIRATVIHPRFSGPFFVEIFRDSK